MRFRSQEAGLTAPVRATALFIHANRELMSCELQEGLTYNSGGLEAGLCRTLRSATCCLTAAMIAYLLVFIPALTLSGYFILMGNLWPALGWRAVFVRAAVLGGVSAILIAELLSLFQAVSPLGLAMAWLALALGAFCWLGIFIRAHKKLRVPRVRFPKSTFNRLLALLLAGVLGLTTMVAWFAPPQTWDSLNYHMPRMAHWAQENAVRHFATGNEKQNSFPPGAEVLILHTYVLFGSDRFANFVQWLAMVGSVVGAFAVAEQLGAGRNGRWLAAVFAATIPMGIVQSSSTMNDYVVAFWTLCAASESLRWMQDRERKDSLVFSSLAAGLAVNTKPTSLAFLAPFAVLTLIELLRERPIGNSLKWSGVAVLIVAAINAGYLGRNVLLYGNPIGSERTVSRHTNGAYGVQPLLSNVIRNAILHMGTPKKSVNDGIYAVSSQLHEWMGIDDSDPRTTLAGPFGPIGGFATHEDVVGNLIHSGVILASFSYMVIAGRRLPKHLVLYGIAATFTFLLFSWIFKWQIFGTRLHMPFFILYAPLVGSLASAAMQPVSIRLVSLLLIIAAIPWLISINSRPILPLANRSMVDSILLEPRRRLLFANGLPLLPVHKAITERIRQAECERIGIALRGGGAEYPLWFLLGAPRDTLQIEWITSGPSAERYEKEDFQPCAVICQRCPASWRTARGLPEVYRTGEFRLFLQN